MADNSDSTVLNVPVDIASAAAAGLSKARVTLVQGVESIRTEYEAALKRVSVTVTKLETDLGASATTMVTRLTGVTTTGEKTIRALTAELARSVDEAFLLTEKTLREIPTGATSAPKPAEITAAVSAAIAEEAKIITQRY